jgi:casein kinase II subunit beta
MADKLRAGRVKVYCPRCEEVYVPFTKPNLDGAFFGSSLANMFLSQYKASLVTTPSVQYYEPRIYGFKVAGKRGSKFFAPASKTVLDTAGREQQLQAALAKKDNNNPKKPRKRK